MDTPENEQIIRSLAVLALTNPQLLEDKVNQSVMETDIVVIMIILLKSIESKYEQLPYIVDVQNNDNANLNNYFGNSSLELQTQIGLELQDNCLPHRDGILVLLTTLKTESSLQNYQVWRGLSTKIPNQELRLVKTQASQIEKKKPILVTTPLTVRSYY